MASRRRLLRVGLISVVVGGIICLVAAWIVGDRMMAPAPRVIDTLPTGLPVEEVTFDSASGSRIHGWFIDGSADRGTVVLLHGRRGDRRSMLGLARFLHRAGYATLGIDLQAHGERATASTSRSGTSSPTT